MQAGIAVYLITDCLEHREGADITGAETGSFQDFVAHALDA